jgi:hypothetical protein
MVQTRSMITTKTSSKKTVRSANDDNATVPVPVISGREPYELRPRVSRVTVTIPLTPYSLRPRISFQ